MPIHNYTQRYEQSLKAIQKDNTISAVNKDKLKLFLDTVERTDARKDIICRHIKPLLQSMPDVIGSMNDAKAISKAMKQIRANVNTGHYETIKAVGKSFVRFYNDDTTPKGWKHYKSVKKNQRRDLSEDDMISWDEIKKLSQATNSIMFKALVELQGEAGLRPSELLDLNYNDIKLKDGFIIIHIREGKTGARDTIAYKCAPTVQQWLKNHPFKKNSPLWLKENVMNKQAVRYDYYAMLKRLRELGKKIKFAKPLDLYALRHSACYQAKMDNMATDEAAKNFGHSVTYYTDTYGRLGVSDRLERHKKHRGVLDDQDKAQRLINRKCTKCGTINQDKEYCETCNNPLTMAAAMMKANEIENLQDKMAAMQQQIVEMLKAQGLAKLEAGREIALSRKQS